VVRILILHCVSKKACDYIFCNNWNNECPIIIIFGSNVCLLHDSMDKDQLTFFGLLQGSSISTRCIHFGVKRSRVKVMMGSNMPWNMLFSIVVVTYWQRHNSRQSCNHQPVMHRVVLWLYRLAVDSVVGAISTTHINDTALTIHRNTSISLSALPPPGKDPIGRQRQPIADLDSVNLMSATREPFLDGCRVKRTHFWHLIKNNKTNKIVWYFAYGIIFTM